MGTPNSNLTPGQVWENSPFGENSIFHPNFDANDGYLLQITITKKPKDFGDTLSFEVNTNLPVGERIDIYFYDSDSYFSDEPNIKKDTELYKVNYTLSKNTKISIQLTNAMEKLAFKDFENSSAECYVKITNAKIKDAFSEVFNVNEGNNESSLDKLAKIPISTPDWLKLKNDADKTPLRKFTEEEINDLTATVIGESGHGQLVLDQQMAIAWVYYNRLSASKWIDKSLDACLTGFSYAYKSPQTKKPTQDVMVVMTALGNKKYANEQSGFPLLTVQQLVSTKNGNTKEVQDYIEKGKILKVEMIKQFATPKKNPYPGYTNQGYWLDLCKSIVYRSDDPSVRDLLKTKKIGELNNKILPKDIMWVLPMLYFHLQKAKQVPSDYDNTFVTELRTKGVERITTFIFKLPDIMQFFKDNSSLMPEKYIEIPIYVTNTGNMRFLTY